MSLTTQNWFFKSKDSKTHFMSPQQQLSSAMRTAEGGTQLLRCTDHSCSRGLASLILEVSNLPKDNILLDNPATA